MNDTRFNDIRFAEESDREAIVRLWGNVFGDSKEYINRFLDEFGALKYALVAGSPVKSMLFMLPIKLAHGKNSLDGRYIYAVATDKNCRGQGLCGALMERAHELSEENGEHFCMLVPAEKSLFGFYGKTGYSPKGLGRKRVCFERGVSFGEYDVDDCGFEEFVRMRDEFFSKRAYFKWDENALNYNYREVNRFGGKILKISSSKDSFYAVCRKSENTVFVKEHTALKGELQGVSNALCEYFNAESCDFTFADGAGERFAAAKAFTKEAADIFDSESVHMGFAMD